MSEPDIQMAALHRPLPEALLAAQCGLRSGRGRTGHKKTKGLQALFW